MQSSQTRRATDVIDLLNMRNHRQVSPPVAWWPQPAVALLLFGGCAPTVPPTPPPITATSAPGPSDFARDVEPIFAEHCYACHGPDEEEGGLRLDEPARRLSGGVSGSAVVVPGDRSGSLLYQYITGQNEDHVIMPPKDRGEPLSPDECEVVGRWIDGLGRDEG
jgi:mono/diheme cytochrome c family protein